MIFFGSRAKTVSGQAIETIPCPSCGKQQFATFGVIRYFHLYWIPTFPTSKTVGIECTHCKKTLVGKEIPKDLNTKIKSAVFNKRNTASTFSGTIIIACLVLFFVYSAKKDDVEENKYIESPALNDLYTVDLTDLFHGMDPEYKYGLIRIKKISADQIEFQVSKNVYNKLSGVHIDVRGKKVFSDGYYDDSPLYLNVENLKTLKNEGAIYSIDRISENHQLEE